MSEQITPYQVAPKTPLAGSAAAEIREQAILTVRRTPVKRTPNVRQRPLSKHRRKLLDCLVDETMNESVFDVGLLGLGMVDKFQGIRHRLLDHSERAGKSVAVIFEAAL